MKRIVCISLVVSIVFASQIFFQAKAAEEIIDARRYAQLFIEQTSDNSMLSTDEVIPIYDENDMLSGFSVSLLCNDESSGYVVIKFTEDRPVVTEFTTELGVKNLYYEIADKTNRELVLGERSLHSFDTNDYIISCSDYTNTSYYNCCGKKLTIQEYKKIKNSKKNKNHDLKLHSQLNYQANIEADEKLSLVSASTYNTSIVDGNSCIIDYDKFIKLSGDTMSYGFLNNHLGFHVYSESEVEQLTQKYACQVVSMLNITSYFKANGYTNAFVNNSAEETFNDLWDYSCTDVYDDTGNITYGQTNFENYRGLVNYYESVGYNAEVDMYWLTSFSDFKRDIDNNKPCFFSYSAQFNSELSGHAVAVYGYIERTAENYLLVADGWNDYLRYLNFDANYRFMSKRGGSVNITSAPTYK